MQFPDWLNQVPGRAVQMAADFGVTKSAISQWKLYGVPRDQMLPVRTYTDGEVTLEEMVGFVPMTKRPAEQPV